MINIEKIGIIYYEEENIRCLEWVELMKKYNFNIKFERSSHCTEKIIYSEYKCIGFLFSSHNGKLPEKTAYIVKHLVADKESYYFAICSGGRREIGALHILDNKLKERGMDLSYIYTECMFQRLAKDKNELVKEIVMDISKKKCMKEIINKKGFSKKELQKEIRESRRDYIKYLKEKKKRDKE